MLRACLVLFVLLPLLVQATDLKPQESRIFFPELESRIASELGFSLRELSKSEQAPATLFGEPLGGSFTWSSFAFTLSRFQLLSGEDMLGGQPTAPWIQRGLASEVEGGGKTFSQLFAAAILLNSCKVPGELSSSPLWTSLSPERRLVYKNFLDVRRFVDDQGSPTGGLPNNYAAVALLLEAYRSRLGLTDDPRVLFKLFEFCLSLLARTDGFLDDHRRFQGSFDRYHHEFIRFVWISAELTGRADILQTLRPWLRRSARLWWDLLDPHALHASAWGRSLHNSWDDSFEQAAFFAARPSIAPATTEQLAAVFSAAVDVYLSRQYNAERHLSRMLEPGRGVWSYAGRDRIWGTTMGSFGKLSAAAAELRSALQAQGIASWPGLPDLAPVKRLQFFQQSPLQPCAVWIHRTPALGFVLPIVGNGALADYLPLPCGLPGLQTPVQQVLPVLVPFLHLKEGQVLSTCQGADRISLDDTGTSLQLSWDALCDLKGKASTLPLHATSTWTASGKRLENKVQLFSSQELQLDEVNYWIPLSGQPDEKQPDAFIGPGYRLVIRIEAPPEATRSLEAPSTDAESRGAFEPVTHYLKLRLPACKLSPDKPLSFTVSLDYELPAGRALTAASAP